MSRRDTTTLGTRASQVAAEVRAETYHETHLAEPAVEPYDVSPSAGPAGPDALEEPVATQPTAGSQALNRLDHRKIVVGVDGSECGRTALNWAVEEAKRRGAELVVVAAWVPQGPMSGPLLAPGADLWADTIEATRKVLNEQVEPLHGIGLTFRTELVGGPPYEALEELSGDADLLVVGNHGRGAVRRTFLGSVSRHVCRHARCPVVVVPRAEHAPTL